MLKSTIVDPRVRLVPSKKLLDFLDAQKKHLKELPENVAKIMKQRRPHTAHLYQDYQGCGLGVQTTKTQLRAVDKTN